MDGTTNITSVPLLDIRRENQLLQREINSAVEGVMQSGRFVLGPEVTQLEQGIAELCQTKYAIGCASGSDALLLALMAADVGPGDEVIVPSFTFFATASAVTRLGARPVFVDVCQERFTIDPRQVESLVSKRTKAIVPVHLFGLCADMDSIGELAKRHRLAVIEDAAQAIGAKLDDRAAGSMGDIGCFSFYPTKNLGGFGDGGIMTTNDERLANRLRRLRVHGMERRYYHGEVGINSRLDTLQAAVLSVKLAHLDEWTRRRQDNANRYLDMFQSLGERDEITTPSSHNGCLHVWNQFTIRVKDDRRDSLRDHLAEASVGTEIYYPVPLHLQECFREFGYQPGSLPVTESLSKEVLSLPIFPFLTAEEQTYVVDRIAEFVGGTVAESPKGDSRTAA